jgi:nucleotide-binding universal stress UspA family protein
MHELVTRTQSNLLQRIVQPTDLAGGSASAFAHGLKLALAARGQFHIVHTENEVSQEDEGWDNFPSVRETLARWGLIDSAAASAEIADRLGVRIGKIGVHSRNPVRGVLRFLDGHPADLIILATHAREGLPRWLRGSLAEPLAREAKVPTLFLPHGSRGFVKYETGEVSLRNVLVPVDREPPPEAAVTMALQISNLLGASAIFHLLHVGSDEAPSIADVLESYEPRLRRLARTGPVVEAIVNVADELDADLLVMATQGHDGILDAFRGSTTEQVLRRGERALLAVPAT